MAPTLLPGDLLVVVHGRPPVPGDVVVGELADGTVAVKRAVERRTTASGAATHSSGAAQRAALATTNMFRPFKHTNMFGCSNMFDDF